MAKECGGCTFCCRVLGIPELKKPEKTTCPHACKQGCSIYETRPKSCSDFRCLWLDSEVMGPELRPDRCGVMFELYPPERTVVVVATRRWATGAPLLLVEKMVEDGYPVWIRYGKQRHLMLPRGMNEITAVARAEAAWRRRNGSA